jgi:hypothetical protein
VHLPVDQLYQTNVAVRDARASALEYANFYGIHRWRVERHDEYVAATGANDVEGLVFRLVQPLDDASFFGRFLAEAGYGVHSICVTRIRPQEIESLRAWLASIDAGEAYGETLADGVEAHYFDTRALLGGFYMQVVATHRGDWQTAAQPDEVWELRKEVTRPPGLGFLSGTRGLNHFGVIVPDLDAVLPNYVRVFGLQKWRGYHWHTGEGSLEETTYMGESVEHAFSTARGDVGRDRFGRGFGFEIVQPKSGPTHFQDFLNARGGPGIHHLSLNLAMEDVMQWVEFQRWMETLGPVAMQGWLRDHAAMYIYSDLSARLGHVVESGIRRRAGHEPDLWYQFTEDGQRL